MQPILFRPHRSLRPLLVSAAAMLVACGAQTRSPNVNDCSVTDNLDLQLIQQFGTDPDFFNNWNCYGDSTANGDGTPACIMTGASGVIPDDGPVCGISRMVLFHAVGCTNWGSGAHSAALTVKPNTGVADGIPDFERSGYYDGTGYEGLAIWARAVGPTNYSVSLSIDDADTAVTGTLPGTPPVSGAPPASRCKPAPQDATGSATAVLVDVSTGINIAGGIAGRVPFPGECGNTFTRVLTVTADWQLYLLPFDSFYQLAYPNRIPSGFDPTTFYQMTLSFPKQVETNLEIATVSFYKPKGTPDGGI